MLCKGETVIINRDLSTIAVTIKRFRPKIAWVPPMFLENFYKMIHGYAKKSEQKKNCGNWFCNVIPGKSQWKNDVRFLNNTLPFLAVKWWCLKQAVLL